jgi:GNAT superfamily N-acetyltransferase
MTDGYTVESLSPHHNRELFSCGVASLDRYLREIATQDQRRYAAAIFLLIADADMRIAGFYTLAAAAVDLAVLPDKIRKQLPRYPAVPATRIGRLAVSVADQGRGLGGLLLTSAIDRSLRTCVDVASAIILVDAIDEAAARFYRHFGFLAIPDQPAHLFMLMSTAARGRERTLRT